MQTAAAASLLLLLVLGLHQAEQAAAVNPRTVVCAAAVARAAGIRVLWDPSTGTSEPGVTSVDLGCGPENARKLYRAAATFTGNEDGSCAELTARLVDENSAAASVLLATPCLVVVDADGPWGAVCVHRASAANATMGPCTVRGVQTICEGGASAAAPRSFGDTPDAGGDDPAAGSAGAVDFGSMPVPEEERTDVPSDDGGADDDSSGIEDASDAIEVLPTMTAALADSGERDADEDGSGSGSGRAAAPQHFLDHVADGAESTRRKALASLLRGAARRHAAAPAAASPGGGHARHLAPGGK